MVCHLHLKGSTVTTGWMPADTAHQACRRMNPATCCFCSFLSSHSTFSAEALTEAPWAEPAHRLLHKGSSSSLTWEKHSRDEQKECTCRYVHTTVL